MHRTDDNQLEIVKALRSVGAEVCDLSRVGFGCPDLLVSFCGRMTLIEVKSRKGKLNDYQKRFHEKWKAPIHVAKTKDEALTAIGVIL